MLKHVVFMSFTTGPFSTGRLFPTVEVVSTPRCARLNGQGGTQKAADGGAGGGRSVGRKKTISRSPV